MDWYGIAYTLAFALFFTAEARALLNKTDGDTFSEKVRVMFRVKGKFGSFAFLAVLGVFTTWFAAHIVQIPV